MTKKNVYFAIRAILKRTVNSPQDNDICVVSVGKAFKLNHNINDESEPSGASMSGNDKS